MRLVWRVHAWLVLVTELNYILPPLGGPVTCGCPTRSRTRRKPKLTPILSESMLSPVGGDGIVEINGYYLYNTWKYLRETQMATTTTSYQSARLARMFGRVQQAHAHPRVAAFIGVGGRAGRVQ